MSIHKTTSIHRNRILQKKTKRLKPYIIDIDRFVEVRDITLEARKKIVKARGVGNISNKKYNVIAVDNNY